MSARTDAPRGKLTQVEQEVLRVTDDPLLKKMLDEERVESEALDTSQLLRLVRYLSPHKALTARALVLALVEAFVMTIPAWMIGVAVDRLAGNTREPTGPVRLLEWGAASFSSWFGPEVGTDHIKHQILFYGAVLFAVWSVRFIVASVTTFSMQKLGQHIVHDLRVHVFSHISRMDAQYFFKNPVGRLVNRTTFDIQSINELFSNAFAQGMRDALFILVLFTVMVSLDPTLGLIIVLSFPVLVLIAAAYRKFARPALRTNSAVQSRMNAWLAENLSGMRENHLYRTEDRRRREFKSLTEAHQTSITRVIRAWGLLRPAMMFTSGITTCVVLAVGYSEVTTGVITVGVLLTFLEYTGRIWQPVRNLTEKFNLIQTALTAGERVFDVLDTPSTIYDLDTADPARTVSRGEIRFDDVTFAYPGKEEKALDHVSFEIPGGGMLALVGDTGAGKSTIARLLGRQYDAVGGQVCVDGVNVRDYTLAQLRSGMAVVPQDVVIFAGTVRENITLGRATTDARIDECVRAVCADTFIDRFDEGLDHVLEEGGRTLSTGERQLLSFARALILNPPILLLDEATANVDTQTEVLIQEALNNLTAGRTSVVIAHRLSTIVYADLILVLRNGEIIERGSHRELLDQGGEYARLHALHHQRVAA